MLSFKLPKDDSKYQWTNHVKEKMVYYGISSSLIKRIVRFPKRKEEGVAPGTTAVMSPYGRSPGGRRPYRGEIWVMYQPIGKRPIGKSQIPNSKSQIEGEKRRIISAWRYPGISPVGKRIPIPDEILQELENVI